MLSVLRLTVCVSVIQSSAINLLTVCVSVCDSVDCRRSSRPTGYCSVGHAIAALSLITIID